MSKYNLINYIDNIKKLYYEDKISVKKIASIYNVGQTTMFRFFDKNNLKTRTIKESFDLKHLNDEQIKEVFNLYHNSNLNRDAIAEKMKISYYSVRNVLDRNCLSGKGKFKLNAKLNSVPLSFAQEQFILGSLLGDSCLSLRKNNGCEDQIEFSTCHGEDQLEYITYASKILNCNVCKGVQGPNSIAEGNTIYRINYYNKYQLINIRNLTHIDNRKSPCENWMTKLTPLALAYWFMDDGSSSYSNGTSTVSILFHTQSFNTKECNILRDMLSSFNIDTTLRTCCGTGTKNSIYVRQHSANNFIDLVEQHINIIPCMRYKIKRKTM